VDVFVTGATGLVGRAVCAELLASGHAVTALSRGADASSRLPAGIRAVRGDPTVAGAWQDELARCDACVHLAGESIAGARWTAERKRRIRETRVRSTENLAAVLKERGPTVLVCGSAVGYYGSRGDEVLDEGASHGEGFLAEVCQAWEAAAAPAAARARVVLVRSGLVLSREGGALPALVRPFRLFAGGPLGDGGHWQPWIHLADEVGLVLFALGDERARGPVNACAPSPVRNRDLARAIGHVLHRPSAVTTPAFALRLALGELADIVLSSQRAVPGRALELGYRFRFPELEPALRDALGR
jgi:uncharacterized protein (TIGR01777 family)